MGQRQIKQPGGEWEREGANTALPVGTLIREPSGVTLRVVEPGPPDANGVRWMRYELAEGVQ